LSLVVAVVVVAQAMKVVVVAELVVWASVH
jgi:hypothetical protein